jgi:RHS repeat-associated protein
LVALCAAGTSSISDAYRYDAFGQTLVATGSAVNPWRYRGLLDVSPNSTPLYALGARFYSPQLGTFTAEDSVAGVAADPLSMNRYLYAEADPTTLIDPDGHATVTQPLCSPLADFCTSASGDYTINSDRDQQGSTTPSTKPKTCTAASLDCSVHQFDAMTASARLAWMRAFQRIWNLGGWFNSIEEVLKFAISRHLFKGGDTWFSLVDAHILAAIQDGLRMFRGSSALDSGNAGSAKWEAFFNAKFKPFGVSDADLKALWGPAEQASTDYGVSVTDPYRSASLGERALKSVTDIWRWGVGHAPGFESARDHYCASSFLTCLVIQPLSYASTDFMDPREQVWIQPWARTIWGQVQPSLAGAPAPFEAIYDWLGLPSFQ